MCKMLFLIAGHQGVVVAADWLAGGEQVLEITSWKGVQIILHTLYHSELYLKCKKNTVFSFIAMRSALLHYM